MKKLTLKELKQHFKNAKDIKSVCGTFEQNININNIYLEEDCSWCTEKGNILFVDGEYAEIISYKEEIKTDNIVESVINQFKERSKVGIEKYGTTLQENNSDDFLQHLKEELMDAVLYIEKLQNLRNEK